MHIVDSDGKLSWTSTLSDRAEVEGALTWPWGVSASSSELWAPMSATVFRRLLAGCAFFAVCRLRELMLATDHG